MIHWKNLNVTLDGKKYISGELLEFSNAGVIDSMTGIIGEERSRRLGPYSFRARLPKYLIQDSNTIPHHFSFFIESQNIYVNFFECKLEDYIISSEDDDLVEYIFKYSCFAKIIKGL